MAQIHVNSLGPFQDLVPSGLDGAATVNALHVVRIVKHLKLMRDGSNDSPIGTDTLVAWAQSGARVITKRRKERVQSTSIYFAVATDAFREAYGHLPLAFVEVRDGSSV
tara:strand:- start:4 stop:330 length:327 start_codon:yes stop_codon:yes gene_type:complete